MFLNWFGSKRKVQRVPTTGRGHHRKPTFERLEDKSLLTTLVVDINDPTADLPGDNLYAEIQEAVDAASEGDLIKVHAGTYDPFEVRTNELTIREARRNSNPIIDNRHESSPAPNYPPGYEVGVRVAARGVTIKGLTVLNGSYEDSIGPPFEGTGFVVDGVGNKLVNNISEGGGVGYSVRGIDHLLKENVARDTSRGFLIHGRDNVYSGNSAIGNSLAGFFIQDSRSSIFQYNRAQDGGVGFFVTDGQENTFRGNTAIDSGGGFLLTRYADNNVLTGNVAKSNGVGFSIYGTGNQLRDNWAVGNSGNGFYIGGDDNVVERNWSCFNEENGFVISEGSVNNVVQNNRAWMNAGWGFLVDAVMDNEYEGNHCLFNGLGGSNQPGVC